MPDKLFTQGDKVRHISQLEGIVQGYDEGGFVIVAVPEVHFYPEDKLTLLEKADERLNIPITFTDYSRKARQFAIYPRERALDYVLFGLIGELGELVEARKKLIRDGTVPAKEDTMHELGDILWYLNQAAIEHGISLEEVALGNLNKLTGRLERGTIHGSGDHR